MSMEERTRGLHIVAKGGRGSGKLSDISHIIVHLILRYAVNAVCIRKIDNTLATSVFEQIKWAINEQQVSHLFSYKTSPMEITCIPRGNKIVFRGAHGNGENERDFIRREITPRVAKYINATKGHKAEVYNPDWNMYADTAAGQRENKAYGMYKYNANSFDSMNEFHLDTASPSATGGHVIIYSGFSPDAIDTRIRNSIKKYVGLRGRVAISKRNDLLQVNVATNRGINYRLVELGFITNANDMKNIRNNVEAYCKALADAITGGASEIKPTNTTSSS